MNRGDNESVWDGVRRRLERLLLLPVLIILVLMALVITADVALRYLFNRPLPASVDVAELVMPWVVFLPMAYTLTVGGHVRVGLLLERIPEGARRVFEVLSTALGLGICLVVTHWSAKAFWHSVVTYERMLAPIPLYWAIGKIAMPVGFGLMSLGYLRLLVRLLSRPSLREGVG